ncbi:MAG: PIN domain-containing protein [Gemmatimonadota bacterium]
MTIHLDTNFLVALASDDSRATGAVTQWLHEDREIHVSAVAWAGFLCGPVTDIATLQALLPPPVAFEADDAAKAAALFNATGRRSRSLQDCMIAAAAIRANAELATMDMKGFRRYEQFGLRIVR